MMRSEAPTAEKGVAEGEDGGDTAGIDEGDARQIEGAVAGVGLHENGAHRAAAQTTDPHDAGAVTNAGWDPWTPINAAAIGAHLLGSVGQLLGNRDRISTQQGVGAMSLAKTGLTVAALGVTGWSRLLGKKVSSDNRVPLQDATTPVPETPDDVAAVQRQLAALQWAVPALTGALVVISAAFAGEQQRPLPCCSDCAAVTP